MMGRPLKRAALATCFSLLASSASVAFAEKAPPPPPYAGAYQPQGVDEIGIWREDDESERLLTTSPVVIRDEALTDYVKSVLCTSIGVDRCNSVRVYILREPTFNASMSPNGTMRVFSGLLLRTRNEAELASILGHEFGHFEKRHSVNRFKKRRAATDVLAWTGLLASMATTYRSYSATQNVQLAVYGDIFRHGRDQEREADLLGLGYLNQSKYRPQAASEVWLNLMGEMEASASARGLKKPNFDAIAFTASHPPQAERAAYLSLLSDTSHVSRDDGRERYRAAMEKWIPSFLDDQIKLNDFGSSEYIIQNLARDGWTSNLWFARGELYRIRGAQRDLVNAAEFYANAIKLDANMSSAYRGFGLTLLKLGKQAEGQQALKTYLELAPSAPDAQMIKLMLPGEKTE